MDDKDKRELLKGLLAASAAALGIWGLYSMTKSSNSPEEEEAQAFRDLEKLDPFDPEFERTSQNAIACLNVARTRRKIQDLHSMGWPTDPEVDRALEDMARYQYDTSAASSKAFLEASARLLRAANQWPDAFSGESTRPASLKCGYCDGAGWYICPDCNGSGRNRFSTAPSHVCMFCNGTGQRTCHRCDGRGYQR